LDNYNNIRKAAHTAQESPPATAWDKLENRLDHRVNHAMNAKRKFVRQLVGLMAIMVLVLIGAFVYQETNKNLELSKGHIASWEDLDGQMDQRFDNAKVQFLNTAYNKIDGDILLKRASW